MTFSLLWGPFLITSSCTRFHWLYQIPLPTKTMVVLIVQVYLLHLKIALSDILEMDNFGFQGPLLFCEQIFWVHEALKDYQVSRFLIIISSCSSEVSDNITAYFPVFIRFKFFWIRHFLFRWVAACQVVIFWNTEYQSLENVLFELLKELLNRFFRLL